MKMKINNRFQDRLIASTELNAALVPGLAIAAQKGPIIASVGLDKIAENVSIDLKGQQDSASHARPSMFASISSFACNVKAALDAVAIGKSLADYQALPALVKKDFTEWQGMIATVALSNVYSGTGLKITVDPVQLNASNLVHRCILIEMDKDYYYKAAITRRDPQTNAPQEGYLYYICQNGQPFAIYHPEVGLCAMKDYDAAIFDGVITWYKSRTEGCHAGWKSIMEPEGTTLLDDFCLCRIAWWAYQNGLVGYKHYIQSRQKDPSLEPNPFLIAREPILNAIDMDVVWPGKGTAFGTTMMFHRDRAGNIFSLPELFMDYLLLSYTGGRSKNKMIYNTSSGEKTVCFRSDAQELAEFAPVVPFRRSVVKLLESCTLEEINFDPVLVGGQMKNVTVEVCIRTDYGELFTIHKVYDYPMLRQGRMPYLMVWPFVAMPKGMNLWKKYYAAWEQQHQDLNALRNVEGKFIKMISGMGYNFENQAQTHNIYRPTALKQSWTVCTGSQLFRYALLTGKEDDTSTNSMDMGMVFVPAAPEYDGSNVTAALQVNTVANMPKLSIDFGTTSTVCALRANFLEGGAAIPLPFKDYSRTITCEDDAAKKALDMDRWLGNTSGGSAWSWNRKIFSVAQLFERIEGGGPDRSQLGAASEQEYYVDGRMFLATGSAMTKFSNSAQASDDPLLEQQIMNDMKFNEKLDVKNYQAASIFLAGVYTYAVLYLLSERVIPGTMYINLLASYPNPVTLDALKSSWGFAKTILDKVMDPSMTQAITDMLNTPQEHFYSEATATTAYQRNPNNPLGFVNSLVSLDIGGGTTDISITNNPLFDTRVRTLSLRYAGREIMVSSLIECFRRFSKGATFGLDKCFQELWKEGMKLDQEGTQCLLSQFAQLCHYSEGYVTDTFLHSLTTNSTVRMTVEMLLSNGMHIGKANNANHTNLLRQLIALKFIMVMQVVAQFVRENIDMWKDPATGELTLINNQLDINLSVSGTSAQLMQYVFNCDMIGLNRLQGTIAVMDEDSQKMKQCLELFNLILTQELTAYLKPNQKTNLRIFVDPNVKEKREVSFGLLQNDIAKYVTAPAASSVMPQLGNMLDSFGLPTLAPVAGFNAAPDDERESKKRAMQMKLATYSPRDFQKYLDDQKDASGNTVKWGLVHCMQMYEQIYFAGNAKANRGLGDGVPSISYLLQQSRYATHFAASANAIAKTRAQYMIEDEQKEYTDLLACMYLVDELLDWEMTDCQRN